MIKNGKYFLPARETSDNFKVLFARLAAEGAGRRVDEFGVPEGPWTAEALADAISSLDANRTGIEVRAVQVWFQDNDNGISNENIRWLARIFGCDDPVEISKWQAELRASKDRLAVERRQKRGKVNNCAQPTDSSNGLHVGDLAATSAFPPGQKANVEPDATISGVNLALRTEKMFSSPNFLNMPIAIWGGLAVLWFISFSLGVNIVTYSPMDGIDKQVGLIWSPAWNIGDPILLPMYLIMISTLVGDWRTSDRATLIMSHETQPVESWAKKIQSFGASFWTILVICFLVIFLIQWVGMYLVPLLQDADDGGMIDWMRIALVRPEVISTTNAIWVSFLAYLYSGMIYWFLFSGSLLMFMVSSDYAVICRSRAAQKDPMYPDPSFQLGMRIAECVFRCTVLGILVALTIKVNAAYLVSDAESITGWFLNDVAIAFGWSSEPWTWINDSPSPFFTSFLLLFLLCFVFGACLTRIKSGMDKTVMFSQYTKYAKSVWFRMCIVLIILSAGYILIGQFFGFSILLFLSVAIALASLFWQVEQSTKLNDESKT